MKIEAAHKTDAVELAYLINLAGEGIPAYLWSEMVEGAEQIMEVGARRAAREEGGFSYRNAQVVKIGGEIAGMMIAYRLDEPYETGDLVEYPAVVRPLIELEAQAAGSWYINAIATKQVYRGRGVARLLLAKAESDASDHDIGCVSLIVASENVTARALYLKLGYQPVAALLIVGYPGIPPQGKWELLVKSWE